MMHGTPQPFKPAPKPGEGEEYELRAPDDAPLYDAEKDRPLIDWRVGCFEALGFPVAFAIALALRRDVDREQVAGLIRRGATPMQALEIVL